MVNCQIYIIILGSSAIFANSACKRLIVHKVQSSLACRLQVRNSRSNLRRIMFKVVGVFESRNYLRQNPQKIRMRFSRMKHAISEKLYFVYYLRNGVLSSEITPKIIGLHKVQSTLACKLQVRNSRSNLLRIWSMALLNFLCISLILSSKHSADSGLRCFWSIL